MTGSVGIELSPPRTSRAKARSVRVVGRHTYVFAILTISVIVIGWAFKDRIGLRPGEGIGYWLGIVGASMMVILLGYPLRKRGGPIIPGSVGTWFKVHMTLGVIGPLLVLYHAGFSWRALNSGVALWAMILVALSGLVGRYLHLHLYSRNSLRHREAADIIAELRRQRDRLDSDGALGQTVEAKLAEYHQIVSHPRRRLSRTILASLKLGLAIKFNRHRLTEAAAHEVERHMTLLGASGKEARAMSANVREHVRSYLDALLDAGTFATFERLFALWHVAHIPLYLFLAITAIIHILAAHYF